MFIESSARLEAHVGECEHRTDNILGLMSGPRPWASGCGNIGRDMRKYVLSKTSIYAFMPRKSFSFQSP